MASFAGEFDTVLEVKTDEEIERAIAAVRRSRHADGVKAYDRAKTSRSTRSR